MRAVRTAAILILWCFALTQACLIGFAEAATKPSFAARIEGTVTLIDPQRGLVVVQNQTNAMAVMLDQRTVAFKPGDQIRLEGQSAPIHLKAKTIPGFPDRPSAREWRGDFTGPTNSGDYFLCRMRGYLHPPESGRYRFWIASDDESELWLSSNEDPASTRRIAAVSVFHWTLSGEWDKYPEQKSQPILLEKGKAYYIEAVQVQHRGEAALTVAWEGPGLQRSVIGGQFLSPSLEGLDRSKVDGLRPDSTNGILREYWTNTIVLRGLGLTDRTTQESILKMPAANLTVLGKSLLPEPMPLSVAQPITGEQNFRWAEVEGVIDFVARDGRSLLLELTEGNARMQVRILDWRGPSPPNISNSRVRLQGVCEAVRNQKGDRMAGLLWIQQAEKIPLVEPAPADWQALRATRLLELQPPAPTLVRGQKLRVGGTVVETASDGSFTIRDQGCFYGYFSRDGTNWIQIGDPVEIPMNHSVLAGLAVCSRSNGLLTTANFEGVHGVLPAAQNTAVGPVLKTGTTVWNDTDVTMSGSGFDIWQREDSFQFLHQPLDGDGEIVARITGVQDTDPTGWARAGVMIRESLSAGSRFALVAQTARSGVTLQYRIISNGITEAANRLDIRGPTWIKLVRCHHRIRVSTAEAFAARPGQAIDVLGFVEIENGSVALKQAFCEENQDAAKVGGPRPDTQLVSKYSDVSIKRLLVGPYLASDDFRLDGIRIEGTVTFNGRVMGKNCFFIQDDTGAISILADRYPPADLPQVGQRVRISGHSIAGKFSPFIDPVQIDPLGWGEMPPPITRSIAFTTESRGDGLWIECTGVARKAYPDGTIEVVTPEGALRVWINDIKEKELAGYVDGMLRIRGVMSLTVSSEPLLLVPAPGYVSTLEAPPTDPFALPLFNISNVAAFDSRIQMVHRIRLAGTVTWCEDRTLFVENESGAVRVQATAPVEIKAGGNVDVAGFPERGLKVPTLTESLVRTNSASTNLKPVRPGSEELFTGLYRGRLVQLEAELLKQRTKDRHQILELQIGRRVVEATLSTDAGVIPPINSGSTVAITGVCHWESDTTSQNQRDIGNLPRVGSVELLLRSPSDVHVMRSPPWWTASRVLTLLGVTLSCLLAAMVWIYTLRCRVEARSRQLEAATERLAEESRNAAVLAERQRLAGEIHDSLQQGFTGVRLQLDAADSKLADGPEAVRRYLDTAQSMIQYSLAEVKSALWNWRSPLLKTGDLAAALNGIAQQIGGVSPARIEFDLRGKPQPLSPTVEHHLLRIGQEGITNAIKHANAKSIHLTLDYSDDTVRLTIQDDGRGFVPATVLDERGTHFGLSGLISRARKLGTQLTLSSEPGKGTTLSVVVPLKENSGGKDSGGFKSADN